MDNSFSFCVASATWRLGLSYDGRWQQLKIAEDERFTPIGRESITLDVDGRPLPSPLRNWPEDSVRPRRDRKEAPKERRIPRDINVNQNSQPSKSV